MFSDCAFCILIYLAYHSEARARQMLLVPVQTNTLSSPIISNMSTHSTLRFIYLTRVSAFRVVLRFFLRFLLHHSPPDRLPSAGCQKSASLIAITQSIPFKYPTEVDSQLYAKLTMTFLPTWDTRPSSGANFRWVVIYRPLSVFDSILTITWIL